VAIDDGGGGFLGRGDVGRPGRHLSCPRFLPARMIFY
jgi:hypothetical protein